MYHIPIMKNEVVDALCVREGATYLDATLGGGGHTGAILAAGGKVVAIDRDDDAINYCKSHLSGDVTYIKGIYENAAALLSDNGIESIAGAVMDLGVSSHQLDDPTRGFAYSHDGALDMRMDRTQKFSAYDVVNTYDVGRLADIFRRYGEEQFAGRIASAIVKRREKSDIKTTFELSEIICGATPHRKGSHPAKKTFQAIRIEVNGELKGLYDALCGIFSLIERGGRLAVITFHSLEDRIVKAAFKDFATDCICPKQFPVCVCDHRATGKIIARLTPSKDELIQNTRSTSSTLRIIEKL